MRIQEMGENLSKLRRLFPDRYTEIATEDWDRLIAIRNIISHGYVEIDMSIIWSITRTHLPAVIEQIESLFLTDSAS